MQKFFILVFFIVIVGCGGSSKEKIVYTDKDSSTKNDSQEADVVKDALPKDNVSKDDDTKPDMEHSKDEIDDNQKSDENDPQVKTVWSLESTISPKFDLPKKKIGDFSKIVYPKHPRLYFRDSDLEYLHSKMNSRTWSMLEATITGKNYFPSGITYAEAKSRLNRFFLFTDYPRLLEFYAFMTQNKEYKDLVIKWAMDDLIHRKDAQGDMVRPIISRLAEIYDWFYDDLSSSQKSLIRDKLKEYIDIFLNEYHAKHPNYIQSHSRWGHATVAQGLLALYGDFDKVFTKSYADEKLEEVREHFRNYHKLEQYIAKDGGWHLGWMYAYFYADYSINYLVWTSATSETMLNDWMGELSYWFIYGLKSGNTFPATGDCAQNDNGMDLGEYATIYQAKYKNDKYAKDYLYRLSQTSYFYDPRRYFIRFTLGDDALWVKNGVNSLPLSRYFKHAGEVIARDSWDKSATILNFKSSPFYSAGHHHRDENSFTIDYKAPLALDSGFYDAANTPHYKNYYTRTIAHNAITVYNPNQIYYYNTHFNRNVPKNQKIIANDGGQNFKDFEPVTLEDIISRSKLDGVTKYLYTDTYTYMQGDATKAYDTNSVSLEKRDIVYIKSSHYKHPVTVVYDRVESTDSSFQKRYLLHTQSKLRPQIVGNEMISTTEVYRRDNNTFTQEGKVTIRDFALYPKNADIVLVGDFDLWSEKAFPYYDGKLEDTKPSSSSPTVQSSKIDLEEKSGNWRFELKPKIGKKYDQMLNVLTVNDESDPSPKAPKLIESKNVLGVDLGDKVVIFPKSKEDTRSFTFNTVASGNKKYIAITGYKEGEKVKVTYGGLFKEIVVKSSGVLEFDINVANNTTVLIGK